MTIDGPYVPQTITELVSLINDTYLREFTILDTDGLTYGPLDFPWDREPPQEIELWMGAEFSGISFKSFEEARCFLSGMAVGFSPSRLRAR
jgi:hypothetical protein